VNSLVCLCITKHGVNTGRLWDVLEVFPEGEYIGREELKRFLWLRVRDVPIEVFSNAHLRAHKLPIERIGYIKKVHQFDIDRILDPEDAYQPFVNLATNDPKHGEFVLNAIVFDSYGLFYDKASGKFI